MEAVHQPAQHGTLVQRRKPDHQRDAFLGRPARCAVLLCLDLARSPLSMFLTARQLSIVDSDAAPSAER